MSARATPCSEIGYLRGRPWRQSITRMRGTK